MNENGDSQAIGSGDQDGATGVGALLRASRMRVGEDLRDVSDVLCIRYLYLEAIEEGRYADLPGETYAIGFIRSYSEHLGLDGEEVVRRFRAEQAGSKRANDLAFPTPVPESGVPRGALVFVGVVIALLVYGGWYASTTDEDFFSELIAPVPDRLKNLVEDRPAEPATPAAETPPLQEQSQRLATPAEIQSTPVEDTEQEPIQEPETAEVADAVPVVEVPDAGQGAEPDAGTGTAAAESDVREVAAAQDVTVPSPVPAEANAEDVAGRQADEGDAPDAPNVDTSATDTVSAPAATADAETPTSIDTEPTQDLQSEGQAVLEAEEPVALDEPERTDVPSVDDAVASVPANDEPLTEPAQGLPGPATGASEVQAPQETVTAEDLNAQSLRAATGQADETASVPTEAVEQPENTTSELESSGVPGDEVLDATGAVSDTGVSIRATTDSWVEITDPEAASVVFTGLMRAGASFRVPDRDGLLLDTGNAGGLDFFVDGQPVPRIGGDGTVRKGVSLNAERLRSGTATDQ